MCLHVNNKNNFRLQVLKPQLEHPLFMWPLLLLLKYEHQSFVLIRRNADKHYGHYNLLQNTVLKLKAEPKA